MKRRIISAFLVFAMMFVTIGTTGPMSKVEAVDYKTIKSGDVLQEKFTVDSVAAYYKITATDTMYYRFVFENQSVEVRTGISIADNLLNLFLGKMTIQIKDAYDKVLSDFSVRCGYTGGVSLKLQKGETYYIKATSNIDGNYRLAVTSIKDIGGDTWQSATETLSVGQFVSAVDANGDKDWFWFETDSSDSFYKFSLENISGSSSMYLYLYEYVEGAGTTPLRDKFNFSVYRSETGTKEIKLKPNTKYYFCIYQSSGTGGYLFNITQNLDAVPDTVENAYKIDTDVKVTTALDGLYDIDWFKFTTKDYDAYYYFTVDNLSVNEDYIFIKIYDSNGKEQKSGHAYVGSCPFTVNVKLLPNTEYYFKIYSGIEYSNSFGDGIGNYTVTVTVSEDPDGDTKEGATAVEMNSSFTKELSADSDVDWFKVTLDRDCNVRFVGKNESGSEKKINVYSAINQEKIYLSVYSQSEKAMILDAGEYYIKVSGKAGYYTVGIGDCGSGHNIDYRITPPTATAEGIKTEYCTSCKTVLGKTVIPKLFPGDANKDSKVNLSDVSTILKYIAKWSVEIDLDAADVTHDGKVNLADASLLLKYIAKWDVTL